MYVLVNNLIAIGPFRLVEDAHNYRAKHLNRLNDYVIHELITPE